MAVATHSQTAVNQKTGFTSFLIWYYLDIVRLIKEIITVSLETVKIVVGIARLRIAKGLEIKEAIDKVSR